MISFKNRPEIFNRVFKKNGSEQNKQSKRWIMLVVCIVFYIAIIFLQALANFSNTLNGILSQLQVIISVYLAVSFSRPGYLAGLVLNTINLLAIFMAVFFSHNIEAVTGFIVSLSTIVSISIISALVTRNARHFTEVVKQKEELAALNEEISATNHELRIQMVERERMEQILRNRATTSKMLASISTNFGNTAAAEIDVEIMHTLETLGEYVGVDRCYLDQFSDDGSAFSTSHEWCKSGIEPLIQILQNIPSTSVPWWIDSLRRYETINLPDIEQMPFEAGLEKEIFTKHGIRSLVAVPLITEHQLIGFLGFETSQAKREFFDYEIILLKTIAEIIANALRRANLQLALQQHVHQVEESLEEKNVLLKEIHHRVKNNLQVISSLLNLQSFQIKDPATVQLFRDSQNRVRSMALIHEKLYQSHDLARINFKNYIESLTNYLMRSYGAEAREVTFALEIEQISLGVDQAVPCGLIINELVSNSLKHAFPDNQKGEITIQFMKRADKQFHLIVRDNGVGFPKNIDFQKTASLGIQLVNSLVNQLEGSIELHGSGGTEFRIDFSEPGS